jgi:hypothetical protein
MKAEGFAKPISFVKEFGMTMNLREKWGKEAVQLSANSESLRD